MLRQAELIKSALNELGCEEVPSGCDLSIDSQTFISSSNEQVNILGPNLYTNQQRNISILLKVLLNFTLKLAISFNKILIYLYVYTQTLKIVLWCFVTDVSEFTYIQGVQIKIRICCLSETVHPIREIHYKYYYGSKLTTRRRKQCSIL